MNWNLLRLFFFLFALLVAAFWEVRHREVPSGLGFFGALFGIFLFTMQAGIDGLAAGILGWFGSFLPFFLVYRLRWIGLGEASLMGMIGALWGLRFALECYLYTALTGVVMAVCVLVWHRRLLQGMRRAFRIPMLRRDEGDLRETSGGPAETALTIPYGSAIAIGSALALLVQFYDPR